MDKAQVATNFAFDWYQATLFGASKDTPFAVSPDDVIATIVGAYDLSEAVKIRGQNSYIYGVSVNRGDDVIARVYWGGVNGNDPHVVATSHNAPGVAELLRKYYSDHRVTRVDVCEDYTGEGTWDLIYGELERFALLKGLRLSQVGDYTRGENGRTLYVGSPKSVTYLRLYEKGHESGHDDKNWVRLELVVRPKKIKAREHFATAPPDAFFGASAWSLELYNHLTSLSVPRVVSGTVRAPTDDDRAYKHLIKQYGNLLGRLISQHGVEFVSKRLFDDIIKGHNAA